jgi:RNA polymerase sigma-70 factor, ECF subfamily
LIKQRKTAQDKGWQCFGQPLKGRPNAEIPDSRRNLLVCAPFTPEPLKLSTPNQLSEFLAQVERRAFKQAQFAVRDEHAALDIVQDAMMKLAERYGDRPPEEFPMLFQRILQNTIRDHYRRQKVRSLWTTVMSSLSPQDGEDIDPLDTLQDQENHSQPVPPEDALSQAQLVATIEEALSELPARQREAFLLRYWEEMDTAETAVAMGCSEGSVKTHCSRATHALSATLKKRGIDLS